MGIFQARILEQVALPSSRGPSQSRVQTQVYPHCKQILYCLSDHTTMAQGTKTYYYGTGNCTQYSVITYRGKESETELLYVYI